MYGSIKVKIYSLAFCAVLICLSFLSANAISQETIYYRYVNEKGVNVISSRIPSRYVQRGYDIVTYDGRLLERVPPEASPEEKARMLKEREEQQRLQVWDKELRRRYSHPDDIEAAKQRKLAQNRNAIGIVERNIEKIDDEINRYQSLAAADEREGRDVSEETLTAIKQLQREREIEFMEREKTLEENQSIVNKYNRDIERFKIIRPETAVAKP